MVVPSPVISEGNRPGQTQLTRILYLCYECALRGSSANTGDDEGFFKVRDVRDQSRSQLMSESDSCHITERKMSKQPLPPDFWCSFQTHCLPC